MTTSGRKLRAARLERSAEEHAALRVEAAKQDISQAQLARNDVRESLARRKGGGR
jgi:hypothetical protein